MALLDISNRCSLDLHRTSVRPYLIMCIIFPPWFLSGDMLSASCAIIKHQMLCYWYFGVNLPHSATVLQYFVTSCLQALPYMVARIGTLMPILAGKRTRGTIAVVVVGMYSVE